MALAKMVKICDGHREYGYLDQREVLMGGTRTRARIGVTVCNSEEEVLGSGCSGLHG